jgi:hypothetical protein
MKKLPQIVYRLANEFLKVLSIKKCIALSERA